MHVHYAEDKNHHGTVDMGAIKCYNVLYAEKIKVQPGGKVEPLLRKEKPLRKPNKAIMYHYWKQNKNVIFAAISLFIVSLTALLFFLNEDTRSGTHDLKANVVNAVNVQSTQEEEEKYREILGEAEGPFVILTLEGNVEYVSWDYEAMTGYTKKDEGEKPFFALIHPDDLSKVIAAFGKVIAHEASVSMVGPYRIQSAQDQQYLLHIASFHPLVEEGKLKGIGLVILDITNNIHNNNTTENETESQEDSDSEKETHKEPQGPKIRNEENDGEEKRLVVEKLAQLLPEQQLEQGK